MMRSRLWTLTEIPVEFRLRLRNLGHLKMSDIPTPPRRTSPIGPTGPLPWARLDPSQFFEHDRLRLEIRMLFYQPAFAKHSTCTLPSYLVWIRSREYWPVKKTFCRSIQIYLKLDELNRVELLIIRRKIIMWKKNAALPTYSKWWMWTKVIAVLFNTAQTLQIVFVVLRLLLQVYTKKCFVCYYFQFFLTSRS